MNSILNTKNVKDEFKYFLLAVSYVSFPIVLLLPLRIIFSKSKIRKSSSFKFQFRLNLEGVKGSYNVYLKNKHIFLVSAWIVSQAMGSSWSTLSPPVRV